VDTAIQLLAYVALFIWRWKRGDYSDLLAPNLTARCDDVQIARPTPQLRPRKGWDLV